MEKMTLGEFKARFGEDRAIAAIGCDSRGRGEG